MAQIPTIEDFLAFRRELLDNLNEIKVIVSSTRQPAPEKRWLKSADIKQLLQISHGTLQRLRDTNQIKFKRIGEGTILYDRIEIERMISEK